MIKSTVHTMPIIDPSGVQEGRLIELYQSGIPFDVKNPPIKEVAITHAGISK